MFLCVALYNVGNIRVINMISLLRDILSNSYDVLLCYIMFPFTILRVKQLPLCLLYNQHH